MQLMRFLLKVCTHFLYTLISKGFKFLIDGMHGIAGIYAAKMFSKYPNATLLNCVPKEDFGDGHPDPNLVYAHDLVHAMGIHGNISSYDMGAACDGDADRNMILGNSFFVTPSDSVAILAANSQSIPYFSNIVGVARSMPTSAALDQVAKSKGWNLYEVPTGIFSLFFLIYCRLEIFRQFNGC